LNVNPYAPPAPPTAMAPAFGPSNSGPVPWEASGLIGQAWSAFKLFWAPLLGAAIVTGFIDQIPGMVPRIIVSSGALAEGEPALVGINLVTSIVGLALSSFFSGGLIVMNLKAARGVSPSFGDAFSGGRYFLSMLGVSILTGIIVGLGLLALIVPGIILIYGLMLAPYYVVDQELGAVEAMKASWAATTGQKGSLFVLSLLCGLLLIAGLLACGVGLFVAIPLTALANALAYLHIAGRIEQAPAAYGPGYGAPAGYAPPAAGYGPPGGGGYGSPPAGGFGGPPGGGYGPPGAR
jgi:hypothetical protein